MARPAKKGLDYFPFDTGFFETERARILKARFGADGLTLYISLLCKVYRENGYYLKINNTADFFFILADELNINENKVQLIIEYLLPRSMFDANLFKTVNVLSAREIQRNYVCAMRGRKKSVAEARGKYWLLSEEEESELATFYKSANNPNKSEKNPSYSENNPANTEDNTTDNITRHNSTEHEVKESMKEEKGSRASYAEIMEDFGVSVLVKSRLWEFIRHCQLNGRTVTNDKLENIIVRLDTDYGTDEMKKVAALDKAINKGYFDIA